MPEQFLPFKLDKLLKYKKVTGHVTLKETNPSWTAPALTAVFHPVAIKSFNPLNVEVGHTVVVYTEVKSSRPWIGIVKAIEENGVSVHWLKKNRNLYESHNHSDGSPYISQVPMESLMFLDILVNNSPLLSSVC